MRKSILLILLTLIIALNTNAQHDFGIKGGINISTVENYFYLAGNTNKYKLGLNSGLFARIKFNKNFRLQPEFFYSQKGSKYGTSIGDRTLSLNYFSLPLLGQYLPNQKFAISLGPELNFRTGSPTAYRKFDLTMVAGVAYWIKRLGIDLRYDLGFNSLIQFEVFDENGNETGQKKTFGSNRVLQLSLMYTLTKSK